MPFSDHIKHMESGGDFVGDVHSVTQFEPYYFVLTDLRDEFNPERRKTGPDYLSSRGREYSFFSNHDVEQEVVEKLADRYGPGVIENLNGAEAGPRTFTLPEHAPVTFDSEAAAFGMQSKDRDSLDPVCDVIDVLIAEAHGEPSFMDIYGQRFEEVPPEYQKLVGRVLRLSRLRKLLTDDRAGAAILVGHEKRLVRKAYDEVMGLDDVEERELEPLSEAEFARLEGDD